MSIENEWIVLDTNIWIFGLRNQSDQPACYQVLRYLNKLLVKVPYQIFLELKANLVPEEVNRFFRLITLYPNHIEFSWEKADLNIINKYRQLGCKLGDAAIAASLEMMGITILVSENRDFYAKIEVLPFQVLRAEEILYRLDKTE